MTFTTVVTGITVLQAGKPIYSESATRVQISDEGGGPFLEIVQADSSVRIEEKEWESIKGAIEEMFVNFRSLELSMDLGDKK